MVCVMGAEKARGRLEELYKEHRPAFLKHLARFLDRFPGRENDILELAERRFRSPPDSKRPPAPWRKSAPPAEAGPGACRGVVHSWVEGRGFGFIADSATGQNIFVHRREIGECGYLIEGETVWFHRAIDPRNGKMQCVRVSGPGARIGGGGAAVPRPPVPVFPHPAVRAPPPPPPPPPPSPGGGLCKLFVGGLPYDMVDEQVRNMFAQFGEVTEVYLMRAHKNSTDNKGAGFVRFATPSQALQAIASLNGKQIPNGKKLQVKIADAPGTTTAPGAPTPAITRAIVPDRPLPGTDIPPPSRGESPRRGRRGRSRSHSGSSGERSRRRSRSRDRDRQWRRRSRSPDGGLQGSRLTFSRPERAKGKGGKKGGKSGKTQVRIPANALDMPLGSFASGGGGGGGGKGKKKGGNPPTFDRKKRPKPRGGGGKRERGSAQSKYQGQEKDVNGMWFCDCPDSSAVPGKKFTMQLACYPGMDPLAVSGRLQTASDGQFQVKGEYDVPTNEMKIQLLYCEEPGRERKGQLDVFISGENPLRLAGDLVNPDGSRVSVRCQLGSPPGDDRDSDSG